MGGGRSLGEERVGVAVRRGGGARTAPAAPGGGGGGDDEDPAAGRAGRVGAQPCVDAPDVKAVPARREDADLVAFHELGETDRAVREPPAGHGDGAVVG